MDRPLERRASTRTAVVWDSCRALLEGRSTQTVVDIGGGTGGFAVRLAELGHRVTVIEPSPDALAALGRRAAERGVASSITAQQGDLAELPGLVEAGSVDLVLCHEVLGLVEDPEAALRSIGDVLSDTGVLSLLVSQRHAAVLARAVSGQFSQALALLDGPADAGAERRFAAGELTDLIARAGLTLRELQAIRVFTDLVPSALLDLEPGAVSGLLELERAVAGRPEYLTLAAQIHAVVAPGARF